MILTSSILLLVVLTTVESYPFNVQRANPSYSFNQALISQQTSLQPQYQPQFFTNQDGSFQPNSNAQRFYQQSPPQNLPRFNIPFQPSFPLQQQQQRQFPVLNKSPNLPPQQAYVPPAPPAQQQQPRFVPTQPAPVKTISSPASTDKDFLSSLQIIDTHGRLRDLKDFGLGGDGNQPIEPELERNLKIIFDTINKDLENAAFLPLEVNGARQLGSANSYRASQQIQQPAPQQSQQQQLGYSFTQPKQHQFQYLKPVRANQNPPLQQQQQQQVRSPTQSYQGTKQAERHQDEQQPLQQEKIDLLPVKGSAEQKQRDQSYEVQPQQFEEKLQQAPVKTFNQEYRAPEIKPRPQTHSIPQTGPSKQGPVGHFQKPIEQQPIRTPIQVEQRPVQAQAPIEQQQQGFDDEPLPLKDVEHDSKSQAKGESHSSQKRDEQLGKQTRIEQASLTQTVVDNSNAPRFEQQKQYEDEQQKITQYEEEKPVVQNVKSNVKKFEGWVPIFQQKQTEIIEQQKEEPEQKTLVQEKETAFDVTENVQRIEANNSPKPGAFQQVIRVDAQTEQQSQQIAQQESDEPQAATQKQQDKDQIVQEGDKGTQEDVQVQQQKQQIEEQQQSQFFGQEKQQVAEAPQVQDAKTLVEDEPILTTTQRPPIRVSRPILQKKDESRTTKGNAEIRQEISIETKPESTTNTRVKGSPRTVKVRTQKQGFQTIDLSNSRSQARPKLNSRQRQIAATKSVNISPAQAPIQQQQQGFDDESSQSKDVEHDSKSQAKGESHSSQKRDEQLGKQTRIEQASLTQTVVDNSNAPRFEQQKQYEDEQQKITQYEEEKPVVQTVKSSVKKIEDRAPIFQQKQTEIIEQQKVEPEQKTLVQEKETAFDITENVQLSQEKIEANNSPKPEVTQQVTRDDAQPEQQSQQIAQQESDEPQAAAQKQQDKDQLVQEGDKGTQEDAQVQQQKQQNEEQQQSQLFGQDKQQVAETPQIQDAKTLVEDEPVVTTTQRPPIRDDRPIPPEKDESKSTKDNAEIRQEVTIETKPDSPTNTRIKGRPKQQGPQTLKNRAQKQGYQASDLNTSRSQARLRLNSRQRQVAATESVNNSPAQQYERQTNEGVLSASQLLNTYNPLQFEPERLSYLNRASSSSPQNSDVNSSQSGESY